ncbi:adhesin [Actinoplanes sp. TBRC 11911]|uniref:adhesin n=1 Tax=Actinoplanes sp. TBRC 11911 TaxID=2729386 RepID=UPI00289DBDD4|nr:adhesin [Actinoplanes sp. TBRC 11911]
MLVIIVLFVQCSGGGDDKKQGKGAGSTTSQAPSAPASQPQSPEPTPSFLGNTGNGGGPSLPAPGDIQSQQPGDGSGSDTGNSGSTLPTLGSGGEDTNVGAPSGSTCADSEIALTPKAAKATLARGDTLAITLTIKNKGARTCSRDVGAGPQELYIDMGARKYWSSDTCNPDKSSDVRQLHSGETLTYNRTWNGRQSSDCSAGNSSGPTPPPGQYQLHARLGTLISNPVALTIQ